VIVLEKIFNKIDFDTNKLITQDDVDQFISNYITDCLDNNRNKFFELNGEAIDLSSIQKKINESNKGIDL